MYHNRKVERTYESGNKDDDDDDYYCVKLDEWKEKSLKVKENFKYVI